MTDHADLIVRLKRHREVMGRDMLEWELVNHDGPEAASAIEALVNDVRVLKAERDEARQKLDMAHAFMRKHRDRAAKAEAERDEARALLREARGHLADHRQSGPARLVLGRIDALLAEKEGTT